MCLINFFCKKTEKREKDLKKNTIIFIFCYLSFILLNWFQEFLTKIHNGKKKLRECERERERETKTERERDRQREQKRYNRERQIVKESYIDRRRKKERFKRDRTNNLGFISVYGKEGRFVVCESNGGSGCGGSDGGIVRYIPGWLS